jgi:hypothetical protein
MRALLISLAVLGLTACGQAGAPVTGDQRVAASDAAADADTAMGRVEEAQSMAPPMSPPAPPPPQQQQQQQQQPLGPAPISYLAYSYQVGIEVPGQRLTPLMDAHTQACLSAGPRLCQLIAAQRQGDPDASITGSLSIRGEPTWLRGFMARLEGEARAAGGRIRARSTTTEDLTRAIVDTEARLRAKRTLRDRLERLLASRPGRLSDLLQVEDALARVQGEIDETQSYLAVMRTRVDMSTLTVSYESGPRSVASDTFEPLRNALASFLRIVVQGLAIIVVALAGLLPFALLAWLVASIVLAVRRSRGGRLFGAKPEAPPPPAANA